MAAATVSRTRSPQARTPGGTSQVSPDRAGQTEPRSILDNLILTNKAMLGQIQRDVAGAARNPLGTIASMIQGFAYPFLHPSEAAKGWIQDIQEDRTEGVISTAATVTTMAWVGAVVVAAGAIALAPVTGGASLAVAAGAFAVGDAFFLGTILADAAGIALHQYRGATAKSAGEAIAEGEAMAGYVEDEVLNVVAWKAVSAAERGLSKAIRSGAGRLGGKALAEGLSFPGVYDLPVAVKAGGKAVQRAARPGTRPAVAHPPTRSRG